MIGRPHETRPKVKTATDKPLGAGTSPGSPQRYNGKYRGTRGKSLHNHPRIERLPDEIMDYAITGLRDYPMVLVGSQTQDTRHAIGDTESG